MRLTVGAGQLYLLASSSATLAPQENGVDATMSHGTVEVSTSMPARFQIDTPLGIMRGADSKQIFRQVSLLSPSSMRISAYEGTLIVEGRDGEEKTIEQGETYRVSLAPDADQGTPPPVGETGARYNLETCGRGRNSSGIDRRGVRCSLDRCERKRLCAIGGELIVRLRLAENWATCPGAISKSSDETCLTLLFPKYW